MALADAARAFHLTVAPYVTTKEAVAGFEKLCAQRDQVVASVPITHMPMYRRRFKRQAEAGQKLRLSELASASTDTTGSIEQIPL